MNLMELFLMILWNRVERSLQIPIFLNLFLNIIFEFFYNRVSQYFWNLIILSVKFIIVISRFLIIYLYVLFKLIVKFFQKLYKQLDILNIFFAETKYFFQKLQLRKKQKVIVNRAFNDYQSIVLEDWIRHNKEEPYATHDIKQELASKTNLSIEQVSCWLDNKRASFKKRKTTNSYRFEPRKRLALKELFATKQKPNKKDIQQLSRMTGLTEKQITSWFAKERFKLNN